MPRLDEGASALIDCSFTDPSVVLVLVGAELASSGFAKAGRLASGWPVGPYGEEGSSRGRFCEGAAAGTGEVDMAAVCD